MQLVFLDTNLWSHVVQPAPRPDRREFVDRLKAQGLSLAWSVELLREVGRTNDADHRREIADAIVELAGEDRLIEPNHIRFGAELCEAIARDHPEWVGERLVVLEHQFAMAYRDHLWRLVRGDRGEPASDEERAAILGDAEIHGRLSTGDFVARPTNTLAGLNASQILELVRNAPRQPRVSIPKELRERRAAVAISASNFDLRVKIQLLNDLIVEAFDARADESDGRRFLTERLAPACNAETFTHWVWNEMRSTDAPSFRIAMAASLGQALRRHQRSNLYDRDHAELLTRVKLLVTADRGLGAILGHPKLRPWIPPRHMYVPLQKATSLDALFNGIQSAIEAEDRA